MKHLKRFRLFESESPFGDVSGATRDEIEKIIHRYKDSESEKFLWEQNVRQDFYDMANGKETPTGLRKAFYKHWFNEDFKKVIEAVDGIFQNPY